MRGQDAESSLRSRSKEVTSLTGNRTPFDSVF
jgi:hypothetical protein